MRIELTFRLCPESRGELIDKFGGEYREFRAYIEDLQRQGVLPPVAKVNWVLVSGRWDV